MIEILRLQHRIERDKRITTHLALTARACGSSRVYYSGDKDSSFENSINSVVQRFGGAFEVEHVSSALKLVKEKKKEGFVIVHLTMYGKSFEEKVSTFKGEEKLLFIVGGEKVEAEYYELADFNVSVSSQPLSEVSALGIVLYTVFGFASLEGGELRVIPQERGKKLENL